MTFDFSSPNYPFIKVLDDSKTIKQERPTVIFAPNGSGKSTLFKILKEKNASEVIPFAYDDHGENYSFIEGAKKQLTINFLPEAYTVLSARRDELMGVLKISAAFKSIGILKKDLGKVENKAFNKFFSNDPLPKVTPLSETQRIQLKPLLEHPEDVMSILKIWDKVLTLAEKEKQLDAFLNAHLDIALAFQQIDIEKHKDEIEEQGCPFCGGKGTSGNAYLDMVKKKADYQIEKIVVFKNFSFLKGVYKSDESLSLIDQIIKGISTLNEEQVQTLLFTSGNPDKETALQKEIVELKSVSDQIVTLEKDREDRYNLVKSAGDYAKERFKARYPGCSIDADDKSMTVSIKLERAASSYSEGEKHRIYQTIMWLSAEGSPKKYILIDDPLTELDAANEYKTASEIADLAIHHDKFPIVFSCSLTVVNLLAKYAGEAFAYLYMESHRSTDGLEARLLNMDIPDKLKIGKPYVTLSNLAASHSESETPIVDIVTSMVNGRAAAFTLPSSYKNEDVKKMCKEASKNSIMMSPLELKRTTYLRFRMMKWPIM